MDEPVARTFVDVTIPAHPEAMVLARLQVAGVGRLLDLDLDDLADLRLAMEELCLSVLAAAHDADRLAIRIEWDDATITARCELSPLHPGASTRHLETDDSTELADQILDALVEAHGLDADGGTVRAWFRKKRPAP